MIAGALVSDCGLFRYKLWRIWDETKRMLVFVMLNPSVADASINDPTIVKCIGFAERLGYGGIMVVNLFAYRATKPSDLKKAGWQTGGEMNTLAISGAASAAKAVGADVVCAWGANARGLGAAVYVTGLLRRMGVKPKALAFTDDGIPRHPLMLPYSCQLQDMPA